MFSWPLRLLSGVFILIFFINTHPVYANEVYLTTGGEALNNVLKVVSKESDILPPLIEREAAKAQPVFIFIPGILGSKLMNPSGKVLWGISLSDEVDLEYNSNQDIIADLLEDYKILTKKCDVYGEFFSIVDLLNVGNVRHLLYFAYDWRQDNRISADRFDKKLKTEKWQKILSKRKVVLVAHSMGGLLVTYWFHKYYDKHQADYPFKIERVIFLGTPHKGALSALQAIIEGYNMDPNANWFFRCFENIVLDGLNKVGHTFPSVYQLLPFHDKNIITLETKQHRISYPQICEIGVWKKFDWLKKIHSNNKVNPIYENIEPLLEDGVKFHQELNKMGPVPDAIYFYSNSHKTPTRLRVTQKNGEFKSEFVIKEKFGDGKVTKKSAINRGRIINEEVPRGLSEQHGQLAKDDNFIEYIELLRERAIAKSRNQIAKLSLKYPLLFESLVSNKVCLEVPLLTKIWKTEPIGEILHTNDKIIRTTYNLSAKDNVAEYIYNSALETKNDNVRNKLYSLAIAHGASGNIKHYSSSALATSLREKGKLVFAAPFAKMAAITPLTDIPENEIIKASENAASILKEIQKELKEREMEKGNIPPKKPYENGKLKETQTSERSQLIDKGKSCIGSSQDGESLEKDNQLRKGITPHNLLKNNFQNEEPDILPYYQDL